MEYKWQMNDQVMYQLTKRLAYKVQITLVGLRTLSSKHALTSKVTWQIGGRESLNSSVVLLKWPFTSCYSHNLHRVMTFHMTTLMTACLTFLVESY